MAGSSLLQLASRLAPLLDDDEDVAAGLQRALDVLVEQGLQPCAAEAKDRWLSLERGFGPEHWAAPSGLTQSEQDALVTVRHLLSVSARLVRESERHRRTQERLDMLSQASFEGIMIHVDGVIVDANQRLAEMLGYDYSEVIGAQTMRLCVAPEDYQAVLDRLAQRQEGEYVITGIRKDGSRFRAEIHAKQGRIGARPVRVAAVRDVTERERLSALLKESEQRLRELAARAFDFTVTSRDGLITSAAGRCFEVMGYSAEQMVGRALVSMVAPSSLPRLKQILADDKLGAYEVTARTADGQMIPVEIIATRATLDGDPVRVAGVRDLRQARELENERRRMEQQLERSQRLDSLGVMAGGIAHDFNNLLVGIMGNAELLLDGLHDEDGRDAATAIVDAGRRAADLVAQMLSYAGRGATARSEAVDLGELFFELRRLLAATLSKKATVEIVVAGPVVVLGSRAQLTQVFMNLLTNASDALEGKAGRVTIRVGRVQQVDSRWENAIGSHVPTGERVLVEVQDEGVGMNAETIQRAFEPFFSTKKRGHGLGLAACLGIVSSHHGAMLVQSEIGRGSTFSVLLPASEQKTVARPAHAIVTPKVQRQVLVVDDEQIVRSQLRRSLELRGYQVQEAASGTAALEALRTYTPDVIVLDMTMQDMDGAEVLERIRQRGIQVPVVLASGYMDRELEQRLESSAFQGFLRKPYAIAELLDTVEGALVAS